MRVWPLRNREADGDNGSEWSGQVLADEHIDWLQVNNNYETCIINWFISDLVSGPGMWGRGEGGG